MNVGFITCIWFPSYETDPWKGAIAGMYRVYFFTSTPGFYFPSTNAVVNDFGDLVEVPA